jgi:ubiquinone/menaquinone biosynthesis C-methylase UbiE
MVELLFKLWSPIYDSAIFQRPYYRRVHARMLATLAQLSPSQVLDLGCGTAQLTDDLRRQWPRATVVGLDLSAEMLAAAQRRLGASSIDFVRANSAALPFAEGSFDLVTSSLSYHWYPDAGRVLAQLARVIRPGGRFVLATLYSPARTARVANMQLHSLADLRRDFAAHGFAVESVERVDPLFVPTAILVGARR